MSTDWRLQGAPLAILLPSPVLLSAEKTRLELSDLHSTCSRFQQLVVNPSHTLLLQHCSTNNLARPTLFIHRELYTHTALAVSPRKRVSLTFRYKTVPSLLLAAGNAPRMEPSHHLLHLGPIEVVPYSGQSTFNTRTGRCFMIAPPHLLLTAGQKICNWPSWVLGSIIFLYSTTSMIVSLDTWRSNCCTIEGNVLLSRAVGKLADLTIAASLAEVLHPLAVPLTTCQCPRCRKG